jgi:YD repeat-containing protein
VVLDLAGQGIKITPLSQSNVFITNSDDTKQHLTAWAGKGNGVLFYDPTGQGALTQKNQVVFTSWDPSAKSDMQALRDVFDTNHDGKLDAGDANFNNFFVMVTNANGTQTAYSLAQLGITSINLVADATNIVLPDGSSIDGETTYTTSSGGTGAAATVTFAFDPDGHVVATATTTNADGSTTIDNVALNADGSVAFARILNTSADGLSKVLTDLNAGGVVTTLQTDVTSGTTETLTNYAGGTIASNGELTSAGVSGSEKLNSQITTTATVSGGGTQVTILRDQLGGGWTTQEEVDTYNANGSLSSIVISDLNPDGSANSVTTTSTTFTSSGSTRTTTTDVDGLAADSTTSVDQIVVNGGTQTETVTNSAGTTVTSLFTTVTQTASNSVTATTTKDLMDGTTTEVTSVAQTIASSAGSTTTQTDTSALGALQDETVTTNTPQTSGGLVTTVVKSERDGFGNFIETGSETTTISNAGATATTTVADYSANGTLLSEKISTGTVGSAAGSVTTYGNGDGEVTRSRTVTVNGGTTTDTVKNLNGDGSLVNATVTATTSGGLAKTISVDSTGAGTAAAPVFDHITTDVTTTSGGSSTETVTDYGAAISAGDEIDKTQTVVSANGLTTTVYDAFTSASLAGGTWDQIATDQTTVNSDGSLTKTTTVTDGAGHVLETTTKGTSANRQLIGITTTLGTTGLVGTAEAFTIINNSTAEGTAKDTIVNFDQQGDVTGATITRTSADGLVKAVRNDIQGQSAAAYAAGGLTFDRTTIATTVINADGSRTATTNVTSQNGTLLSTSSVSTSANGLTITTTANPYATAHFAEETTNATVVNLHASTVGVDSDYNYNGALIDQTTTTVNFDGTAKTVLYDLNGDGVTDQSTTDLATVNANGSRTEIVTDYTGGTNGTVRDVTTATSGIIVAGAGLETQITRQSNGSVPTYQVETVMPSANGTVTDTTQFYAHAGGPLLLQTTVTTSANGLVKTTGTAVNGDTTTDFGTTDTTVLNADGSQTETVANFNRVGLISETVTTTSANGLSKTTKVDANGALNGSAPVFDFVTTDNTVLNTSNGSRTETVTASAANGATIKQAVTTTSADQQTITTNRYLNETGNIATVDQSETIQTQANGSVTDTISSYDASHNLLGTVVKTRSGNGLAISTQFENASGTTVDAQSDTTTFDSNGDGGTTETCLDTDNIVSGITFTTTRTKQTAGNAQSATTTLALAGALSSTNAASFSVVTNDSIAIADTGVTTETTTDAINGASSPSDTTTVVTSANRLTTTTSTALGSASPYIVQQTSVALDGSQSKVTTFYDPTALSVILEQNTVNTSYDGRTVTTTRQFADDQLNQSFDNQTPSFSGSGYNVETDTVVDNADGTTTETRSGTGSFGAPAYTQTVNVVTNADASQTTTTLNYDATGALVSQFVADASPDGLVKTLAYDTTGKETIANLDAVAADLISGAALPTSMLGTDIIKSDVMTLNADGSKTEVDETGFGNSFSNLRTLGTTETSANGLVTTTFIDRDGSGDYKQIGIVTDEPDGSKTEVYSYYDDILGTQTIDGMTVGATLVGTNSYTISANGMVTTLTTSSGVTDTTVDFANSNGSYEFSRSVTAGSVAAQKGYTAGSASHFVDANGIDTWSYNNGSGNSGMIAIDLATENQDIAIANEIYQTLLGRPIDDAETQYLAKYMTDGVLNREQLAFDIVNSSQFNKGSSDVGGFNILAALENALGRLPTAEELATFDQSIISAEFNTYSGTSFTNTATTDAFVTAAVAIAQYAMDEGAQDRFSVLDPQGHLAAGPIPTTFVNPSKTAAIQDSGTYSFANYLLNVDTVGATINGNDDVVVVNAGDVTVSGFNDAIDVSYANDGTGGGGGFSSNGSITASNATIMIGDGNIAVVAGSNDQISQIGPSELTLTSGTGDVICIAAATLAPSAPYANSYSITNASNASIIVASGAGTAAAPELINGNNDTVSEGANAYVTVSGTGDTVNISGTGSRVTLAGGTVTLGAGLIATVYGNNNTINMVASSTSTVAVHGTGDVVSGNIGSNNVGLIGVGSSATVSGIGQVGLNASGETATLTSTGALAVTAANTTSETINGSSDTIDIGNGSSTTITGNNDSLSLGTSSSVYVNGTGSTIAGSNASITLASGGNSDFVNGSSDTISVGSASYAGITGNSDSVSLGTGSSTTVTGTGESISATGDGFTVAANSQATVNGGGDQIVFGGANAQVTITGDATNGDIVYGSGGTINVGNGQYAGVHGNDNITIGAGAGVDDIGTGATVTFTGSTGILAIDQPDGFTGQIFGFTGTAPDPNHSDAIYLAGFTESSYSVQNSGANEILTLHDSSGDVATLTFDNFNAALNISLVGGYTLITDPPLASAGVSSNASAFGSGQGSNSTSSWQPQPQNGSFMSGTLPADDSGTSAKGSPPATWQQNVALLSNYMATAFASPGFGGSGAPSADAPPFIPAIAALASQQFVSPQHPS